MLTTGANLGLLDYGKFGEPNYAELLGFFRGVDLLVQPHVKSATTATPPTTPADGDSYIIPTAATGVWAGKAGQVARWTARDAAGVSKWEYFIPKRNWVFGVDDAGTDGKIYRFNGTSWVEFAAGGTTTQAALPVSLLSAVTPAAPNATDGSAYEMGAKLRFAQSGVINSIRYYKAASETGAHIGHIWDANGNLLASVVFSGESASGWQEQALAAPLRVTANTTYIISVNVNSHYAMTTNGLTASLINGDITSVADGANGVFNATPGQFPSTSFNNSNYFRDVVFTGDVMRVSTVVGYTAGQGGTVTQQTSKGTAVTLNKPTGEITTAADPLAVNSQVSFTLNSSAIESNDVVVPIIKSGTAGAYTVVAEHPAQGSCLITLRNVSNAPLSEAVKIGYVVLKGTIA